MRSVCLGISVIVLLCASSCASDDDGAPDGGLSVHVAALGTGSCDGDRQASLPLLSTTTLLVTQGNEEIARADGDLSAGEGVEISVPVGDDYSVQLFADGADGRTWYGRTDNVVATAGSTSDLDLLVSRLGLFEQIAAPADNTLNNTIYGDSVTLGDGRILFSGGFERTQQDGTRTYLGDPSRQAAVFDPISGVVTTLTPMLSARAAHRAVYLATTNEVLVIGGAARLQVVEDGNRFALDYDPVDGRSDYEIFDVASQTWRLPADTQRLKIARAFPRASVMSDGAIVISGGSAWPFDGRPDTEGLDVYDPAKAQADGSLGGLLKTVGWKMSVPRAAHTVTPLGLHDGIAHHLVWGGVPKEQGLFAEILIGSGQHAQANGRLELPLLEGPTPPNLYFHAAVPMSGDRVLLVGGTTESGGELVQPAAEEAWLVTWSPPEAEGLAHRVEVRAMPGMGVGRTSPTVATFDGLQAVVVGGFAGVSAPSATASVFNIITSNWTSIDPASSGYSPRGGHAAAFTRAGALAVIGGEAEILGFGVSDTPCAHIDLLAPSYLELSL